MSLAYERLCQGEPKATVGGVALESFGSRFDQINLTDIELVVEDAQVCTEPTIIFADGFESGDTTAWSTTYP